VGEDLNALFNQINQTRGPYALMGQVPRERLVSLGLEWHGALLVEWQTGWFWGAVSESGGVAQRVALSRKFGGDIRATTGISIPVHAPQGLQNVYQRLKQQFDPQGILPSQEWGTAVMFDTSQCVHCGLCLTSCPTYQQTGIEGESPRGRIFLLDQIAAHPGLLDEQIYRHLDDCLDCRACEEVCPAHVPTGHLVDEFRASAISQPYRQIVIRSNGH